MKNHVISVIANYDMKASEKPFLCYQYVNDTFSIWASKYLKGIYPHIRLTMENEPHGEHIF